MKKAMMRPRGQLLLAGLFAASLVTIRAELARPVFDEEMTTYRATAATGPVAALQGKLEAGEVNFAHDAAHGYLMPLLKELQIPAASQLLVASKTSPNKSLISPKSPRALFFNDEAAVAYVPGADLIEIAAGDPKLGVVFYTLNQKESQHPRLVRDDRCLECHASSKTLNVPGLMVRSFVTADGGDVDVLSGIMVTHRTPLNERWGGYFVTGFSNGQTHRGNIFGTEAFVRREKEPLYNCNLTDLNPLLAVSRYPEPSSDIVALMTLEHQAHAQNLLTRVRYDSLNALATDGSLRPAYPAIEAALKYMLFVDEYKLAGPIQGAPQFARAFEQQGPKDKRGRSLRQFDLQTRLFKFPCSYMIYSPAFEALPPEARKHFYQRLGEILDGHDQSPQFASLTLDLRQAVRQILVETKPDLPADWRY